MRKPNNLCFQPSPTQTSLYTHRRWGRWLEAGNFGFRKKRNCTVHVVKTKALISFAVTAKLICAFVFANANCWFSHAKAHFYSLQESYNREITIDGLDPYTSYTIQGAVSNYYSRYSATSLGDPSRITTKPGGKEHFPFPVNLCQTQTKSFSHRKTKSHSCKKNN